MKRTLIKNCRIVSPECSVKSLNSLLIINGKIADVGDINVECDEIFDAEGNYLLPGLIDMNCKICEDGYESKDNLKIVSLSASAGGFTSLAVTPDSQPVIDNKTVVDYVIQRAKAESEVNIYPCGSITKGCNGRDVAEMGKMISKGIAALSDNGGKIEKASVLRDVLMYSKMFDVTVISGGLDESLSGGKVVNEGIISTKLGLSGSPREAEEIIVARNLVLGRYTGARLHIPTLTTEFSVELVEKSKGNKENITAGTCPHYFTLTEEETEGYNTYAKVNPPLRTKADAEAIKKGIYNGTIDTIASGHTPASIHRKQVEFDTAACGISSLETAFAVSFTALCNESFTVSDLVEKMAENPAKILNLKNKGAIKKGYDADLIIADLDNEYTIRGSEFYSKAKYTPYEGKKVKGKIIKTFVNGKKIFG
ncbi:MAG: dihydroorotase [Clostridiales bacterium]|nr:dihydroorotase [Clostridiales bacterium]